ncbi:MAG: AgmX/PglI C-terminal domain-containing protein [Polyangia bacterium]
MSGTTMESTIRGEITEDASRRAVEVASIWNGTVLEVDHLAVAGNQARLYRIGEAPSCSFPVSAEDLDGADSFPLVSVDAGGTAVAVPRGAGCELRLAGGERLAATELLESGLARRCSEHADALEIDLPPGAGIEIGLGRLAFSVKDVAAGRKPSSPVQLDWSKQIYSGLSLLMHCVFFAILLFIPPSPHCLSLDGIEGNNRFVPYMIDAPSVVSEREPDFLREPEEEKPASDEGRTHEGPDGEMGDRDAPDRNRAYAIKGRAERVRMARPSAVKAPSQAGILHYIGAAAAPTSPFGAETASGIDPENALGHLIGDDLGDAFGYGGLGIRDTGRGGGGDGSGTIGVGRLDTIGRGGRNGKGPGLDIGKTRLGPRRSRSIVTGIGRGTNVAGTLSKKTIRRIVHRHMNEVKFCYQRALASRPELEGRIAVKFVISGKGTVQAAAVSRSTVGNAAMESCVVNAARRWTFPQPEDGGVVIVTYPFGFRTPQ